MLYFLVIVHTHRVQVREVDVLSTYHHKARVDGCIYLYKMERDKLNTPQDKGWWERALQTVHYHANNSGAVVTFDPVSQSQYVARRKVSAKQLRLF